MASGFKITINFQKYFTVTYSSAWVNRSKNKVKQRNETVDLDDIATKIQAGYKGMIAREETNMGNISSDIKVV